jgi:hypothetical protein
MRLQDFITIALGCQIPWNVNQRCLSSIRYCSLHHYTPTSESVDFLNTVIGKVLISIRLRHLRDRFTTATSTAAAIPGQRRISDQTVRNRLRGLAVGTYPKGEICYSGKHSAPWIHVSWFHLLVTGR